MAQRRMFSLQVVDTDKFTEMSVSARLLYYELGMRADDDGFIASPKKIIRSVGCSEDDLKLLIAKGFIIPFDSGIIVIRHWKMNNYLRADRYKKTIYQTEAETLTLTDDVYNTDHPCLPLVYQNDTNGIPTVSTGKESLGEANISCREPPTIYRDEIAEIIDYLNGKLGTRYRASSAATQKHITARLREGYTTADFKTVIVSKTAEWFGTKHAKYLRPETLFGSKFEGYLNAATATPPQQRYTVTDDEPPLLPDDYDEVIDYV